MSTQNNANMCVIVHRAWQHIKTFMDTKLSALLQQPPLTSSRAQAANSKEALAQTANAFKPTTQVFESMNLKHAAAAKALFPVVMAIPKDSILQLLAVRGQSPASCCTSAAAACNAPDACSPAVMRNGMEAATQSAGRSPAATEAVSINPAAAKAGFTAAPNSPVARAVSFMPAAAEAVAEVACISTAAVEAACISPAATNLFLNELHSTDLFQVVCHCLDQAQQQLAAGQPMSCQQSQDANTENMPTAEHTLLQAEGDNLQHPDVSCEAMPASEDRGAHVAFAAADDHATRRAVPSIKAPNSSIVWHGADVNEALCQSDAEMADDEALCQSDAEMADDDCQRRISHDCALSQSCQVQLQQNLTDTAVQASCCPQVLPSVPGSRLGRKLDCSTYCLAALPAEQTAIDTNAMEADDTSPPLAEMICMLLLLVPRTAWHRACDEVRSNWV